MLKDALTSFLVSVLSILAIVLWILVILGILSTIYLGGALMVLILALIVYAY